MFHCFSISCNDTKSVNSLLVNYTKIVNKKNNLNLSVIFRSCGLFETIKSCKQHQQRCWFFFFLGG